jgi:hypothetical protein
MGTHGGVIGFEELYQRIWFGVILGQTSQIFHGIGAASVLCGCRRGGDDCAGRRSAEGN